MTPDLAVRLADATPLVFMDVVVLEVTLFLLSRMWVMVAPRLGRRVARWALLLGLPLLLVASTVVHVAAPAAAQEVSEGVDFTSFFICIPLGVVWLGWLLYRLVRRFARRREAVDPQEYTLTAEWLRLALVTLPVMGLVPLIQWQAATDEVKAMNRRAGDLANVIRALEATEAKTAEFAREREQLAEKVESLHTIVPRSPDLEQLVTRLARPAYQHHLPALQSSGL